jgi:hypothetical protein
MKKPWFGYLGSLMILLAGVLLFFSDRMLAGILLILAALAGIALKYYLYSKDKENED